MLADWDFSDEELNNKRDAINRRKSAQNLELLLFDQASQTAEFKDDFENVMTSLQRCSCTDFNYVGGNPRKSFKPCKHIYRLASELGLIELKYLDFHARQQLIKKEASTAAEDSLKMLKLLPRDPSQWGAWNSRVHEDYYQELRIQRGFEALQCDQFELYEDGFIFNSYQVDLEMCTCMDFFARRIPCKHIYALAIYKGLISAPGP